MASTAVEIGRAPKLKPFGPKARKFAYRWPEYDARINIIAGSVRSAKTWSTYPKILQLCRYEVGGQRFLTGVSKQTIYQNVLMDLFDIVGEENYSYNRLSGELKLLGATWIVIGAKDEGSEKYIRGATVGCAVCDELVLMPRTFFHMLLARMSPAGSRLYGTTNPDIPYHWLKTEILENPHYSRGLNGKDLFYQTFTMEDNPSLNEEYKAFLRRSYTGVFFDRYVLGKWVMAEGAIYGDVLLDSVYYEDRDRPKNLYSRQGHVEHWVSVDYGTTNPMVYLDAYDDGSTVWVDREYYWDSRRESRQKTDAEYADDMIAFVGGGDPRFWPGVIVDPSAASFRVELLSRGFYVVEADNDVMNGIRRTSTALARGKVRIHRRCVDGLREMQSYSWEKKKEKPLKEHDHWPDALRYYTNTRMNDWRLAA